MRLLTNVLAILVVGGITLDRVQVVDGGLEADRRDSSSITDSQWNEVFDQYKGSPEYQRSSGMSLKLRKSFLGIPPQDNGQDRGPAFLFHTYGFFQKLSEFSNQGLILVLLVGTQGLWVGTWFRVVW